MPKTPTGRSIVGNEVRPGGEMPASYPERYRKASSYSPEQSDREAYTYDRFYDRTSYKWSDSMRSPGPPYGNGGSAAGGLSKAQGLPGGEGRGAQRGGHNFGRGSYGGDGRAASSLTNAAPGYGSESAKLDCGSNTAGSLWPPHKPSRPGRY